MSTYDIDLKYQYCGYEKCRPKHKYGPALRSHYLIHFVFEGKGIFEVGNVCYEVTAGQGFLIEPGKVVYYEADENEPWGYIWVGFSGDKANSYMNYAGISYENPVFSCKNIAWLKQTAQKMFEMKQSCHKSKDILLTGMTEIFIGIIIDGINSDFSSTMTNPKISLKEYVKNATEYIYNNYSAKISVADIARYVSIDKKYLSFLFATELGISPHKMLIDIRLRRATELLEDESLSISTIARSVGYDDPLRFSKVFKQNIGIPPSEFRDAVNINREAVLHNSFRKNYFSNKKMLVD